MAQKHVIVVHEYLEALFKPGCRPGPMPAAFLFLLELTFRISFYQNTCIYPVDFVTFNLICRTCLYVEFLLAWCDWYLSIFVHTLSCFKEYNVLRIYAHGWLSSGGCFLDILHFYKNSDICGASQWLRVGFATLFNNFS